MWFRSVLFPLVLLLSVNAFSQATSTPNPTPSPNSRQTNPGVDNARFDRLRSMEIMIPKDRAAVHPLLDPKTGIYRRPGKDEVLVLGVAQPLLTKYEAFLKAPDTGIVKLNAESSCISDKDILVASEQCLPFKMPGAGTAYSFRTGSYRLPRLADVILIDGIFRTGGIFQQVVMAELGDIPIEDVTLNTIGMKRLVDLQPVKDSEEFAKFGALNSKGIWSDGLLYRNGQRVKIDSTFALRSIAYRGNYFRSIDGISYDELEYDKRRDVIVAFRVVDKDENGNVTITWKRLRDIEAPKLEVKK
jgi:hypothetical protein